MVVRTILTFVRAIFGHSLTVRRTLLRPKCQTTAKDRSHALQDDDEDLKLNPMSMNYCVLSYILVIVVFVFGHVIVAT